MKNSVAKQIEKLIKEFNVKNEKHNNRYELRKEKFARGSYAIHIDYLLFYSTDMRELLDIIHINNLLVILGTYNGSEGTSYIDIQ